MQKTIGYACVLLLFVISCNDKDSPIDTPTDPVKKCRLVKLIQGTHNGGVNDTTFNFYYNATGKLNMVTGGQAGINVDTSLITYNDSGKLVKVIPPRFIHGTTFTYTSKGLLSEINYRSFDYMKMRFVYNGSSTLPDKAVIYTLTGADGTPKDSSEYRYTSQNGNIISKEIFNSKGVSLAKSIFEYDTIPNLNTDLTLISLNDQALGLYDEVFYFNKNLVKKNAYTDPSKHTYTYNVSYKLDSGKVVQSFTYNEQNPQPSSTRNYFWECQ